MPLDQAKTKKLIGDALAIAKKTAPGADLQASLRSLTARPGSSLPACRASIPIRSSVPCCAAAMPSRRW